MTALCWAGYYYAGDSWRIFEHSSITADGPPLYHFKTFIPMAGAFILSYGETFVAYYVPDGTGWGEGVAYALIFLILLLRPRGLFGHSAEI